MDWRPWIDFATAVIVALVAAVVVVAVLAAVVRGVGRRRPGAARLVRTARPAFRVLLLVVALWIATASAFPLPDWKPPLAHGFLLATIAATAWLLASGLVVLLEGAKSRYRLDVADNRVARRVHTQLSIVKRLGIAVIVLFAIASMLLTFPGVQAVGTSILASAGVLSVVAGLAAQSSLANVFAGVQLAFSDAIRVDDVVIVENEWGRIEEITLTYVVVHLWDDRRLVLPSTYFTTTPFQNWTRKESALLGAVEFDLDWRVSPSDMRHKLDEILDATDLWDGRTKVLQVTDAVGGLVRIRILVTAKDAPTLFDLRCYVREAFVEWLHDTDAEALPRQRVQLVESAGARERSGEEPQGLFTGSTDAQERATTFTSSNPVVEPVDRIVTRGESE